MASAFDEVMGWAARGRLDPGRIEEALDALGATPDGREWRRAASLLLLWMGVVSLAAGVIFFFAYNWQALTRLERLGIADLCGLAALGAYGRYAGDGRGGVSSALLFGVALWVGSLLALVGQTYQTGADIWELFALWAALITPLAVLGRSGAVWGLWAVLINLTAARLWQREELAALYLGSLNVGLVVGWAAASRWLDGMGRGVERLLYTFAGVALTLDLMRIIVEVEPGPGIGALLVGWAATYVYYRRVKVDVYMLAVWCLSMIVAAATLMVRGVADILDDTLGLPLIGIGLLVVGASVLAARWLKGVSEEVRDGQG